MRWWRRSGRRGQSWRRGLRCWRSGMARRGKGWRGWKGRWRGSRELGVCWDRRVECSRDDQNQEDINRKRGFGRRLLEKGIKRYVKIRIATGRQHKTPSRQSSPRRNLPTPFPSKKGTYRPSHFRHTTPSNPSTSASLSFNPILPLEIPDFEPWLLALWHDFLIEPTPYLVLGCMLYLGGVLLVAQYYALIWSFVRFLVRFVPWDEEFGF